MKFLWSIIALVEPQARGAAKFEIRNSKLCWFLVPMLIISWFILVSMLCVGTSVICYCFDIRASIFDFSFIYPGSDALRRNRYLWALCAMESAYRRASPAERRDEDRIASPRRAQVRPHAERRDEREHKSYPGSDALRRNSLLTSHSLLLTAYSLSLIHI